jgi:tellurite resistance protein
VTMFCSHPLMRPILAPIIHEAIPRRADLSYGSRAACRRGLVRENTRDAMKRLTISGDACTETLALLIAVAWADGRLDDHEKAGVRGAAEVLNLTKVLRDRIDQLLEKPVKVSELLLEPLKEHDRAFAYVAAAWMAHVDGHLDPKEKDLLDEVATALGHSKERQAELDAIAGSIPHDGGAGRRWSEEITTLFKAIPRKLDPSGELDIALG